MELLIANWGALVSLTLVGGAVGGLLVFALAKTVDSGKLDSKETRIFIKEEQFK